jgi:hypothetical protein
MTSTATASNTIANPINSPDDSTVDSEASTASTPTMSYPLTSSIFNNPDRPSQSNPTTPSAKYSNAGAKLQSFSSRRYASSNTGRTNDAAIKEVDDPTSTPSYGCSPFDRGQSSSAFNRYSLSLSPLNSYGQNNSYRGWGSSPEPPSSADACGDRANALLHRVRYG